MSWRGVWASISADTCCQKLSVGSARLLCCSARTNPCTTEGPLLHDPVLRVQLLKPRALLLCCSAETNPCTSPVAVGELAGAGRVCMPHGQQWSGHAASSLPPRLLREPACQTCLLPHSMRTTVHWLVPRAGKPARSSSKPHKYSLPVGEGCGAAWTGSMKS